MSKEVVIFSAPWCSGCMTVKKVLYEKNIWFREINIDTEEGMNRARELGIRNIPVTFVEGKKFVGSSLQTIDMILKENE